MSTSSNERNDIKVFKKKTIGQEEEPIYFDLFGRNINAIIKYLVIEILKGFRKRKSIQFKH